MVGAAETGVEGECESSVPAALDEVAVMEDGGGDAADPDEDVGCFSSTDDAPPPPVRFVMWNSRASSQRMERSHSTVERLEKHRCVNSGSDSGTVPTRTDATVNGVWNGGRNGKSGGDG